MLRFYLEVARTAFRRQLVYRWANLAGLLTNGFFGALFSYVMIALFQARHVAAGYDVHDALRYIWIVQSLIMVVLPFGWFDLMQTIRTGEVVADLSKPCDFYWYWFSREAGRSAYYLLFRCVPTYLFGMVFFGIGLPGGWDRWMWYAASLLLAAALGIAVRFLYNIVAFWIMDARAAGGLVATIALFFAGSYIPLAFFPPWLRAIAIWLPFNGLMNIPAEILAGKATGMAVLAALGLQAGWAVAFTLAARAVTGMAARRVVIQGG